MKSFFTACPACAAPVEFRVSATLVTVCDFCRTVVGRGDKDPEDHGKVADLVQTRSPLELGLRGTFKRTSFDLVGRVQYAHEAGGVWDEWYLLFAGGKVGWLAESQGRFHLMMEKPHGGPSLPSFDEIEVGNSWSFGTPVGTLTVAEKGAARAVSAEGQIPWAFRPGALHVFADLHGESGAFGTIEFGDDVQRLFIGREVTLDELRIPLVDVGDKGIQRTTGKQVNCPHCGGPMRLIAPDQTQRVTCSNCSSLLDVEQGNLRYLKTLSLRNRQPIIPLGTNGRIQGVEYTVIGFMERFVVHEGTKYPWTEYLLYEPRTGFRWLVHSENHWNFVEPISAGEVSRSALNARYRGDDFRLFQHGSAKVHHVLGEFYWRVEVGEKVKTKDYVCPPRMLSIESTSHKDGGEMNVSLGTYMHVDEVEAAFGVTGLPRPWSPGPNQPPPRNGSIFSTWAACLLVLILMDVVFVNAWVTPRLDQWLFTYAVFFVSIVPIAALLYNLSFEHQRWSQSDYSPYATDSE